MPSYLGRLFGNPGAPAAADSFAQGRSSALLVRAIDLAEGALRDQRAVHAARDSRPSFIYSSCFSRAAIARSNLAAASEAPKCP